MIWIAFAYPSRSVFAILILNKKNMTKIKLDGTESNSEDSVLNRNGLYLNCCSIWFQIFDRYLCSKLPNMFLAFDKTITLFTSVYDDKNYYTKQLQVITDHSKQISFNIDDHNSIFYINDET